MAANFDQVFQLAAAQQGLDPNILKAIAQQESSMNPQAVNPESGAAGVMGFMPATAKAYGIDPMDPSQAIPAAAQMFKESLTRSGGDVGRAVADHFAGPDPKLHGPKTAAYVQQVAAKFNALGAPQAAAGPSVDDWLGKPPAGSAPQAAAGPSVDDWLGKTAAPAGYAYSEGPALPGTENNQRIEVGGTSTSAPAGGVSFLGRAAKGAKDVLDAGAQLATHALPDGLVNAVNSGTQALNNAPIIGPITQALGMTPASAPQIDQDIKQSEQQYQAQRAASGSTGFDVGRMLGNIAGVAPLALAAGPAAPGVLGGAALGAANGALTPVLDTQDGYWKQKALQIGLGGAVGGIAPPVAKVLGSAIGGAGGAAQQQLAKMGVNMTPGQIMGGALAKTEDKLTSVPVLGDLIRNAQQRSIQDFNRATYDRVLEPLGTKYSGPVGSDGVAAVRSTIKDAYSNALGKMHFSATDPVFQADITNLGQMAQGLPADKAQQFARILKTQIFDKLGPQGTMDGQALKGVQSELGRSARGYSGDPSFDTRQLGAAVGEMRTAVEASLARTNPAEAVQGLANANAAYANFVRLRSAAGTTGAGANEGIFTPSQLASAVRSNDKSVGKGNFATGDALMQDLSSVGQKVLGNKYPDSGTVGRGVATLAIPALAGHAMAPGAMLPLAIGGGVASLPYTAAGQKIAQYLMMNRPAGAAPIGQAVSKYGALMGPALGAALLNGGANR